MRTEREIRSDVEEILLKAKFENAYPYHYIELFIPLAKEAELLFSEEFRLETQETQQRTEAGRENVFTIGLSKLLTRLQVK